MLIVGGDDLVEQRTQSGDGEVERAGDQHRAMAGGAVLAHAANAGGEALGDDELGQQFAGVLLDLVDGRVLVASVEVAEEVGAIAPVELQQPGAWRSVRMT